jgi:hypothetical protein
MRSRISIAVGRQRCEFTDDGPFWVDRVTVAVIDGECAADVDDGADRGQVRPSTDGRPRSDRAQLACAKEAITACAPPLKAT